MLHFFSFHAGGHKGVLLLSPEAVMKLTLLPKITSHFLLSTQKSICGIDLTDKLRLFLKRYIYKVRNSFSDTLILFSLYLWSYHVVKEQT